MNRDELWFKLLNLLDYSSPAGYEQDVLASCLPRNGKWDKLDNYIISIGEKSSTLFACHLDTVGESIQKIEPLYDREKQILYTDDRSLSCLGGDDRCGILTMLALIEANVPGTYVFHSAEEVGMHGAKYISSTLDLTQFSRAIEFDRKGTTSIISAMLGMTMCSQDFVNALAKDINLNFKDDPTGLITDVYLYSDLIPEVTNLSCGFNNAHSNKEYINVLWLIDYFIPHILNVNWENLPVIRDPNPNSDEDSSIDELYGICDSCQMVDYLLFDGELNLCEDCELFRQHMENQVL